MDKTDQIKYCMKLLADLKSSLARYEGLSLEEYDCLYGDIEEIQYNMYEVSEKDWGRYNITYEDEFSEELTPEAIRESFITIQEARKRRKLHKCDSKVEAI